MFCWGGVFSAGAVYFLLGWCAVLGGVLFVWVVHFGVGAMHFLLGWCICCWRSVFFILRWCVLFWGRVLFEGGPQTKMVG